MLNPFVNSKEGKPVKVDGVEEQKGHTMGNFNKEPYIEKQLIAKSIDLFLLKRKVKSLIIKVKSGRI